MKTYIYKFTAPDSKVYIGRTTSPKKRWYPSKYKGRIGEAIARFGWNNFKKEIIAESNRTAEAEMLEKKFIAEYKSFNPEYGFNILSGGGPKSLTTRKHLKEGAHRRWESKSARKAQSKRLCGRTWTWNQAWLEAEEKKVAEIA